MLIGAGSLIGLVAVVAGGLVGYAYWRYSQFHKVAIPGLAPRPSSGAFNVLIVGSDSRAFAGNSGQAAATYGSASTVTGQRSDVTIIARIDPAAHAVRLLSIPRDTYVKIPGNVPYISGYNRINAAYNNGPSLLVKTIEQDFHIPISDYVDINFQGLTNMVNAIGGVYLDFRYPVYDLYSHLGISKTGCHLVLGAQAVALVRSRHLYYQMGGTWHYDGMSDWSRIQRQDAFFRALLPRLKGVITNPAAMNSFLGAAERNITIDRSLSPGEIISLASTFRHVSSSALSSETLPTAPATINGQDVLIPASATDAQVISAFLAFGAESRTASFTPRAIGRAMLTSFHRSGTPPVTVTTIPGIGQPSSSQIVYNTQAEPWNPIPCGPTTN